MKISVSLLLTDLLPNRRNLFHTFVRHKIFEEYSVTEVLNSLKLAGLEGIEIMLPSYSSVSDSDIKQLKILINSNDIPVFSIHQSLRFFTKTKLPEIEKTFLIANQLSANVIVLHLNLIDKKLLTKKHISTLHKLEKKYQIKIGFENMEKRPIYRKYIWHEESFAETLKQLNLHITLDTTHLAYSGGDIIRFIKNYHDKIINIHLSDCLLQNFNFHPTHNKHLPLGTGELPINSFLKILQEKNYNKLLTLEINSNLQQMCESTALIKNSVNNAYYTKNKIHGN